MWNKLTEELDRWYQAELTATFWWRDDDAIEATCALDRLIKETTLAQAPLLLASIPLHANSTLVNTLIEHKHIVIAQHGYAHINHAPRGQGLGAWEMGLHRGEQAVVDDLKQGYKFLSELFPDKLIPVVVPPWNRIDSSLFTAMYELGYKGVSAFGALDKIELDSGMIQINCHCDPIKWKGGPHFTGVEKSIAMICEHLTQRRNKLVAVDEPTGLLTHHLDMDKQSWQFVVRLGEVINAHPAALWCHPNTIFQLDT